MSSLPAFSSFPPSILSSFLLLPSSHRAKLSLGSSFPPPNVHVFSSSAGKVSSLPALPQVGGPWGGFPFPGWMFSWLSYCPSGWQCPVNQCWKLGEMPEFRLQSDRCNGWTLSQDGRVELLQERCLVSREALKEIVADLQWQLQKVVGPS